MNWFKLLALNEGKEDWMLEELKKGNLRYGWSPRGSNMFELDLHSWDELDEMILEAPDWEATGSEIYRKGAFLINRITNADRIVVQLHSPLDEFYLFEITDGYAYSDPEYEEFNHILKGKLLNDKPMSKYSPVISNKLRHDLSKRGRYYQIYSDDSCKELNLIIENKAWKANVQVNETEFDRMNDEIINHFIANIRKRWPAKEFEYFSINLLKEIDGVEIKENWDSHKGWDFTISIRDTLTGEILHDDIPVQCKNYEGEVTSEIPIQDLERCLENSTDDVSIVYLFIMGDLTELFYKKMAESEARMKKKYRRNISYRIVDQFQIAKLYVEHNSFME
jgi:hypothetical protein